MITITAKTWTFKEASHLAVPAHHHLFASEHDICGSLQATEGWGGKLARLADVKNCLSICGTLKSATVIQIQSKLLFGTICT